MRVRRHDISSTKEGRELPNPRVQRPYVQPRVIDVAWASIDSDDLQPGELVFNTSDTTLVYRFGHDKIYRIGGDTGTPITRTI